MPIIEQLPAGAVVDDVHRRQGGESDEADAGNGRGLLRKGAGHGGQEPPGDGLCARAQRHAEDGQYAARDGPQQAAGPNVPTRRECGLGKRPQGERTVLFLVAASILFKSTFPFLIRYST